MVTSTSVFEVVCGGEYSLRQPGERNSCVAELSPLVRLHVAFLFPERVKQTDQRRALTGVIMQIQQLKSAEAGRAQVGFDLFLVARELEAARGVGEIFIGRARHSVRAAVRARSGGRRSARPTKQTIGFGRGAEDFIIPRADEAGELLITSKSGYATH